MCILRTGWKEKYKFLFFFFISLFFFLILLFLSWLILFGTKFFLSKSFFFLSFFLFLLSTLILLFFIFLLVVFLIKMEIDYWGWLFRCPVAMFGWSRSFPFFVYLLGLSSNSFLVFQFFANIQFWFNLSYFSFLQTSQDFFLQYICSIQILFSLSVKKQKGQSFLHLFGCFRKLPTWVGAYIIHQITGTSFSEDDFRPTELEIILSSWSQISHQFVWYESINQSTFNPYNDRLLPRSCLLAYYC